MLQLLAVLQDPGRKLALISDYASKHIVDLIACWSEPACQVFCVASLDQLLTHCPFGWGTNTKEILEAILTHCRPHPKRSKTETLAEICRHYEECSLVAFFFNIRKPYWKTILERYRPRGASWPQDRPKIPKIDRNVRSDLSCRSKKLPRVPKAARRGAQEGPRGRMSPKRYRPRGAN